MEGPTGSPCNRCANCIRIFQGAAVDVIEIDGASNRGIDEIRDVREMVKFAPAEGDYKVYIIDEVHMLTTEAFNALLKVLEEPPEHVVFVFATTEPHKIPATIVSRCQKFDFHPFRVDEIAAQLAGWPSTKASLSIPRPFLSSLATRRGGCGTPWPHWISASVCGRNHRRRDRGAGLGCRRGRAPLRTGRCASKR